MPSGIQQYCSINLYINKKCSRVNTLPIWIQMRHKQNKKTLSLFSEIWAQISRMKDWGINIFLSRNWCQNLFRSLCRWEPALKLEKYDWYFLELDMFYLTKASHGLPKYKCSFELWVLVSLKCPATKLMSHHSWLEQLNRDTHIPKV
jgi:hypothetical protein